MTTPRSLLSSRVSRRIMSAMFCATLMVSSVQALTVRDAPLNVLVSESQLVVYGHVVDTATTRFQGRVWTQSTVVVWEQLGGDEPLVTTLIDVHLPGGVEGSRTTYFPGVPTLKIGDEVVLLLTRNATRWVPLGLRLGVLFGGPDDAGLHHASEDGRPGPLPTLAGGNLRSALQRVSP